MINPSTPERGDHNSSSSDHDDNHSSSSWTDDEFEAFLRSELEKHPLMADYPALFDMAPKIICKWRRRYHGNAPLWKRLFQKDRVLKEFIEAVPIIDAVQRVVVAAAAAGDDDDDANARRHSAEKYTIIDLACGRGYLSMILSELLPPDRVAKFVLVDKAWAMHSVIPTSNHISSAHIYGTRVNATTEDENIDRQQPPQSTVISRSYYDTWPIPLNTTKVDLKKSKEIKDMERRLFNDANSNDQGPIILLAVHLCGTLSIKAVELFNNNPRTVLFCLKPCCLPGETFGFVCVSERGSKHGKFHVLIHVVLTKLVHSLRYSPRQTG